MEKTVLKFYKMNATGNDFIAIDNRNLVFAANDKKFWQRLCALKTGIGADGVLLLEKSTKADFRMRYINADGGEVEMCGNGARAITAFAHQFPDFNKNNYQIETMNGIYQCFVDEKNVYRLKMTELYDVNKIDLKSIDLKNKLSLYLNTGVPHCVFEIEDLKNYPVFEMGKFIRHHSLFEKGTNANFFEVIKTNRIRIRTFERGVEDETLSCGTGVTAAALAAAFAYKWTDEIKVETRGGELTVMFNSDFSSIYLCGKVEKIFTGEYQIGN